MQRARLSGRRCVDSSGIRRRPARLRGRTVGASAARARRNREDRASFYVNLANARRERRRARGGITTMPTRQKRRESLRVRLRAEHAEPEDRRQRTGDAEIRAEVRRRSTQQSIALAVACDDARRLRAKRATGRLLIALESSAMTIPFSIHLVAPRKIPERRMSFMATNKPATNPKMLHCTERNIGSSARRSNAATRAAVIAPQIAVGRPSETPQRRCDRQCNGRYPDADCCRPTVGSQWQDVQALRAARVERMALRPAQRDVRQRDGERRR